MQNDFSDSSKCRSVRIWPLSFRLICVLLCFYAFTLRGQNPEEVLNRVISLPSNKTTIYNALNQITDSTGFLFAYNSKDVYSDKIIKPSVKNMLLRDALNQILGDTTLRFKVINQHILIYKVIENAPSDAPASEKNGEKQQKVAIRGRVLDSKTKQPIPYATIGIPILGIGTITNQDGAFSLWLFEGFINYNLMVAHIGYQPKELSINLFYQQPIDIFLKTEYISLQEVFIRNIEPQSLVREALSRIPTNFHTEPVILTAFYREGVLMNNKYQNYSEAVFNIYKSSYSKQYDSDQVKLLKSRKFHNIEQSDTLNIKLKGGLNSTLTLDIVKNFPDFFDEESQALFNYTRKDIVTIGNRTAYEIAFEQKQTIKEPLLLGVIYIDMENFAILGADFEINPKYVSSSSSRFVQKRNRNFVVKAERIKYSVRFREVNSVHYLVHVRGDLNFKYRKRRSLFYNPFHAFLELATTQIDTLNVKRFDKKEVEKTTGVFTDIAHDYDDMFWRDFNIISPEQSILESLQLIQTKIESIYRIE
jgi:hypothetical protein